MKNCFQVAVAVAVVAMAVGKRGQGRVSKIELKLRSRLSAAVSTGNYTASQPSSFFQLNSCIM